MFKRLLEILGLKKPHQPHLHKAGVSRSISRCSHCGSKKINRGHYIRGWNNLCEQGAGDEGYWCYDCCKVTFIRTLEEYEQIKQDWVTAWY